MTHRLCFQQRGPLRHAGRDEVSGGEHRAVLLNWGPFCLAGDAGQCLETFFGCHNWQRGREATGF